MGFLKKAWNKLKGLVSGGSRSKSSSSDDDEKKRKKVQQANRVTNYGGRSSSTAGSSYGSSRSSFSAQASEEERKRQERQQRLQNAFKARTPDSQNSGTSSSSGSAFKATPPSSTIKKMTPPTPKGAASAQDYKTAFKATTKKLSADRASFNRATGNKYNVEKNGSEARRAQKTQAYDVNAEKWETKHHKIATSAARGALSGVTFGGSELLAQTSKNRKRSGAESYYQKNKSKGAEAVGEIAGSLAGFGLTGGASKAVATKLGGRTLEKAGSKAATRLAENSIVKKAAERELNYAIRKGTVSVGSKTARNELLKELAQNRAKRIVSAIGEDTAINLTTGMASDVSHAILDSDNPEEFAKEMGKNALLNVGLGGSLTILPEARISQGIIRRRARGDVVDTVNRFARAENGLDRLARGSRVREAENALTPVKLTSKENLREQLGNIVRREDAPIASAGRRSANASSNALSAPRVGESIDNTIARRATQTAEQNAAERQMPRMRNAMRETFANNADNARRVDMSEILAQNSPLRQADDAVRPQNIDNAVRPQNIDEAVRPQSVDNAEMPPLRPADEAYQFPDTETYIRELDERGEQWLGQYGHITANEDGTYNLFVNGVGDRTLTREEVTNYIAHSRDALQGEEIARTERERITRTTPLDDAENARIAEIDNELERLRTESNADAEALRDNRYNGLDEYQTRQAERARSERSLSNERNDIVRKEPPRRKEQAERGERTEFRRDNAETAREQEEAIRTARETQTRRESEDLMMANFNETGEADLGMYGMVTPNGDGTYHVKIDGVDREIDIPREEVERRIRESTKRAYEEPKVVDSLEDVVYKRNERASFRERLKKAWGMGRQMISDSLASFEDTERALARAEGRQVDYGAINEVRAHQAKANRSISNRQLDWQGNKYEGIVERVGADGNVYQIENGKSIAEIYKGMDEDTERAFDLYLELRHAPDRLLEGKPVFDNIVDKSGRNFNSAQACREEADRILAEHPEFAQKAEEIYQYTRNELQNRVDAGLLTQETFDDWFSRYPNYVPTHREGFNEIHGVSGSTVGATEIKGAKGSDRGIMSIRDQLSAATTRNWRDMSTNEMFKKYFGENIARDLAQDADGGIERVLGNTINLGKNEKSGKYYADIYIEGKKHTVELEERFYEGLKDLYKNGRTGNALADTTNEAFSRVAGVWKNLITEWSPIFMVKNGMRDFPEAVINSRNTKEFIECMGPAMRDIANGGPFSEALRDAGISQSSFIDLDRAIREGEDKASLLARANGAVEMFPRLCEYMGTLKKAGIDISDPNAIRNASRELKARAAANAADVTVNFGRSGSVGKMINKGLVPFFNPSVQGWSKFVRNITENSGNTKALLSFAVKATALGAGATTVNNFWLRDNENYQQISARDKANNIIIPIGDIDSTNTFIKIPNSRFAAVYGLPMVNAFNENKMGWAEMFQIANDQVAPIDPIESTLFRPFIDAKNNKTWYGTPIVGGALEDLPPSEQYDPNTSEIGKALGRATENLPRSMQISPKKADYIIDAETGIAGDLILPALTPSKQGGGSAFNKYAKTPVGNVLKKQFSIDSNTQNDLSSRFYEELENVTVSKNSAKATDKDKAEYKRLSAYKDEVSGLTKAITDLQNGDRATKQDDIYGLQKVRNQLIKDALAGKSAPSTAKKIDAVQKYVGTTYAINNFGSSTDKEAMKVYGASVYGNLSEEEMAKKIDGDKDFYKGVRAVGKLEDKLAKATGSKTTSALSRSVALAEAGASDELFGAYAGTKKSRTETDTKMNRARNYISNGGSTNEFVKLEKTRKTLGKLSDYDKEAELDKALDDLKSGKISEAEYYEKQGEIKYNSNISYVGLATSLAQANSPSRGYELYDIKAKNVQKGINLAAMGFTARDYRQMKKDLDADGNGYPKKQEIIDYVNSRDDIEDKATLYDALYSYNSKRNPYGAVTNYSRDEAAEVGRRNKVEQISDETGDLVLKDDDEKSGGSGYRRYGRRRWRRWHRWGRGGRSSKVKAPALRTDKEFKAKAPKAKTTSAPKVGIPTGTKISGSSTSVNVKKRTYKSMASSGNSSRQSNVNMRGLKLTPPKPKTKKKGAS